MPHPRAKRDVAIDAERPPAWWAEEFFRRREAHIRRIRRGLNKVGRAMASGEIRQCTSGVPMRESDLALARMIADGEIRRSERREPYCYGAMVQVMRTYYELVRRPGTPGKDGAR